MQKVKLTPDDVLTGAGSYKEEVKIDCPVCDETNSFETDGEIVDCDGCEAEFGVEKPFN